MITDYASLQTEVANHLNRSDMEAVIPTLIQLAEDRLRLDPRVAKHTNRGSVTVSADSLSLPSDLYMVEDWYLDGPLYYGPIEIVGSDNLSQLKVTHGATGVPKFASIVDGVARFAPVPDAAYTTKMTYWRRLSSLGVSNTTNWLLTAYPSIYLYATLAAAETYLKNDARVATWKMDLEERLEGLHLASWNMQFGGTLRIQHRPIG